MCGIIGAFGNTSWITKEQFVAARDALLYRGPDAGGLFEAPTCLLGHRRLSVIDLSSGGQPMSSQDGRYTIIFNGEVYNYQSLKRQLSSYPFQTQSDTEVILAGYAAFGDRVTEYLEGMFAFAIYDAHESTLFLARDPLGIKPLVYTTIGNTFIFASEINGIVPLMTTPLSINKQSLVDFLCLKHVPAPHTIFEDTYKLPAGHTLSVSYSGTTLRVGNPQQYWRPEYHPSAQVQNIDELRNAFVRTVQDHLVADVPVGAYLSGGLDSSSIVWAMKEAGVTPQTYTVGFVGDEKNRDIVFAKEVAHALGTRHHEYIISTEDYASVARSVIAHMGEPFADPAIISSYYVARETVQDVKVVLSGDGGDEVFFGYDIYQSLRRWWYRPSSQQMLEKYFGCEMNTIRSLLNDRPVGISLTMDQQHTTRSLRMRMFDLQHTLPEYYLQKTDASSMMHGLEVRVPFLHRSFVQTMLSIPFEKHMDKRGGKAILRAMMQGKLPDSIVKRPKQGFARPVHRLLTQENLQKVRNILSETPWFNKSRLDHIISRPEKHRWLLWRLLVLAWWIEEHKSTIKYRG